MDTTKQTIKNEDTLDLSPILAPVSIFLSALIIAGSIIYGSNSIVSKLTGLGTTNTAAVSSAATQVASSAATIDINNVKAAFKSGDMITFGDENRKVLFVEVLDPGCPYCHVSAGLNSLYNASGQYATVANGGTLKPVMTELEPLLAEGKISIGFIMSQTHSSTTYGHQALFCANELGKFWEVHNQLLSKEGYYVQNPGEDPANQETMTAAQLNKLAATPDTIAALLKNIVDETTMKNCIQSGKYQDKIAKGYALTQSIGISAGTPTMLLNTTTVNWSQYDSSVKPLLDAALN